jgi:hypothetical protein
MEVDSTRHVGFVLLALGLATAGCGGVKQAPPAEPPKTVSQAAVEAQAVAADAPVGEPSSAPPRSPPSPPIAATPPAATAPAQRPTTTPSHAPEAVAKAAPPDAKAPAKAAAPAAPAAPAAKKEAAAGDAKQQAAPPLDLDSLETRLKDTKAIGELTKLSLKNQVDDLLNQFRAFYAGKLKTTLAELRRPYDLLVLKVLSLLQDKDPPLATDLSASREAIWGILSDPVKFAKI